ncbi:hypothetical protein B566_EDAN004672 [Ephemera danica]|nr:hypothetical protein B566_EDAN004672 [Ephemera danica]
MKYQSKNPYTEYYVRQAGSGIPNVYQGAEWQRGHGIGAKAIGKETAREGLNVLSDVSHDVPVK